MVKGVSKSINPPATLGERIRAIRKAWNWTQEDLAKAMGNDRQIVSYWELDKAKPTRAALQLLSQVFRLPVEMLVTGIGFTLPSHPEDAERAEHLRTLQQTLAALDGPETTESPSELIDLGNGQITAMSPSALKKLVDQQHKQGRRIWIVVDGKG